MNSTTPRPMPFAIMRNAHEALRTSLRLQEQALDAGDMAGFREEYDAYVRARVMHMAMEDDAMFALLDGVSDGAVSAAGLPEEHEELRRMTAALSAAMDYGVSDEVRSRWEAWKEAQLQHMVHEEQVMNPLVGRTADSPAASARVVLEHLLTPVEELPDFEWYIGWVVRQLSDHGSTGQSPNVATRVFAWGLQHACTPALWARLRPVVEANCAPEIWSEMVADFGLDGPGKID